MATQNPIEMEGTYPLPEAQRDRFMARISMGYPSPRAELAMLDSHGGASPLETLSPVTDARHRRRADRDGPRASTPATPSSSTSSTSSPRPGRSPALRLGASPRASLHLLRAARAHAALAGRDHVLPDDVQALVVPVLAHRIIPTGETQLARRSTPTCCTSCPRVQVPRMTGGVPRPGLPRPLRRGRAPASATSSPPAGGRSSPPASPWCCAGLALGFPDLTRIGVLLVGPAAARPPCSMRRSAPSVARRAHGRAPVAADRRPDRRGRDRLREHRRRAAARCSWPRSGSTTSLGDRPRFVAAPDASRGERREVTYAVRSHVRGRHQPRPARRSGCATRSGWRTVATVLPGPPRSSCCPAWSRSAAGTRAATASAPRAPSRTWSPCTARTTWPSAATATATTCAGSTGPRRRAPGELMVRQEDRPARRRAVVVLDSRSSGHRGSGALRLVRVGRDRVSPRWPCTCTTQSYAVHLVSAETAVDGRAGETIDVDTALDALAVADARRPGRSPSRCCTRRYPLTSAGGLVIAVVTDHDEDTLRRVASLRQPGGTGLLLLVEAATFAGPAPPSSDSRAESLAGVVAAAGWSTAVVARRHRHRHGVERPHRLLRRPTAVCGDEVPRVPTPRWRPWRRWSPPGRCRRCSSSRPGCGPALLLVAVVALGGIGARLLALRGWQVAAAQLAVGRPRRRRPLRPGPPVARAAHARHGSGCRHAPDRPGA